MLLTALFVIASKWKEWKCSSIAEWLNSSDTAIQWNNVWQRKETKDGYSIQHRITPKTLFSVKEASHKKPHIV